MLDRVKIQNYRVFSELEIAPLGRINLFTGQNNSGKTTLLEALFLLCGAGTPEMATNTNVIRDLAASSTPADTFWKPMFLNLDVNRTIRIEGQHSEFGKLILNIQIDQATPVKLPLAGSRRTSLGDFPKAASLRFSFKRGAQKKIESRIGVVDGGFEVHFDAKRPTIPALLLSSRTTSPQEDAARLGRLRKRKRSDLVVEALRIVEPRLRSLEDNSASGVPMIWGDIGLPELVPLPVLGDGMTRIARAILAISEAPNGVVLVDEIENGLHHSALPDIWAAVDAAAGQFDTQIVATTHSFECLRAARNVVAGADLRVHRLETDDEGPKCVSYEPEALEAAIHHNLEVR